MRDGFLQPTAAGERLELVSVGHRRRHLPRRDASDHRQVRRSESRTAGLSDTSFAFWRLPGIVRAYLGALARLDAWRGSVYSIQPNKPGWLLAI